MIRKLCFELVLACSLLISGPSVLAQSIPPNYQMNHDSTQFLQNEEQIWMSRSDSNFVMANWRDWRLGFRRVGFAVSTDAGVTWGVDSLLVGQYDRQSDPVLTGDTSGTFYLNSLDYNSAGPESQISVFRSTDNGGSWLGPVATGPLGPYFEDKQFTTVDRTQNFSEGNYYMSWTRFPNTSPALIMFVRSTTGATSFSPPVIVGPTIVSSCGTFGQGQGSIPVVNTDGSVHVFWSGFDIDSACTGFPLAIRHAYSSNGGATFTPDAAIFPSNAYFELIDGSVDVYGFPIADADISGGVYDGTMYIAHTQFVTGSSGETDIQIRKSTDNGLSWSSPTVVNDDPPGQNIDQFHPWLTVNQEGVITMVFYDQRTDPVGHTLFDCYFTASFDGAETFTTNYRISEVSIDPANLTAVPETLPKWINQGYNPISGSSTARAGAIAEYIGVHAYYDHVVAIWTDTRNGNQDAYSTQFNIPFLAPRLYAPEPELITTDSLFTFKWSTCWHETLDSYRLEVSQDSTFSTLEYNYPSLADNEFSAPDVLASGTTFWRVKGFRTAGDSTEYSQVYVLHPNCIGGTAPSLLQPGFQDTLNSAQATFLWSQSPDAVTYDFQLSLAPDFSLPIIDTVLLDTTMDVAPLGDTATYFWRVRSTNLCATGDWNMSQIRVEVCPIEMTGDVNFDGTLTSTDIIAMVNFVFKSGPPPLPVEAAADVNCSGAINSTDLIYLVNYLFKSGAEPCDACSVL